MKEIQFNLVYIWASTGASTRGKDMKINISCLWVVSSLVREILYNVGTEWWTVIQCEECYAIAVEV